MTEHISREKAFDLLHQYIKNPNMIKHCLASEAVMKAIAEKLGEDQEKWALAGLLHDIDVEITNADLKIHGQESVKILQEQAENNKLDKDLLKIFIKQKIYKIIDKNTFKIRSYVNERQIN